MTDDFRPGDHWVIDDVTGLKVRASETRKQWDGLRVHRNQYESRHPQDFVRGRRDKMSVTDPRPRPIDTYIGPLTTELAANAVAGQTALEILSTGRMRISDRLSIMLDGGDTFRATIIAITDTTHLTISPGLPSAASSGKLVYDNTAMAEPDLP
jgi:hypothetical protein